MLHILSCSSLFFAKVVASPKLGPLCALSVSTRSSFPQLYGTCRFNFLLLGL